MIISMFNINCVTNRKLCTEDFLMRVEKIAAENPDSIILREKDLDEDAYEILAEKVIKICHKYNVKCVLHTFYKVAERLECRNIHMPLHCLLDMSEEEKMFFDTIGASCHSVEDAIIAENNGCTYITAGHIFETDCKKGLAPRGTKLLKDIKEKVSIPVYGIGGIVPSNAGEVKDMGADGVCIMSTFMRSEDLHKLFAGLREI